MVSIPISKPLPSSEVQATPILEVASASSSAVSQPSKKAKLCRFYSSKSGCRAGAECPFLHDPAAAPVWSSEPDKKSEPSNGKQAVQQSNTSRIVPKPLAKEQEENPREFQLGQVRRRYRPKETKHSSNGTVLDFRLAPSDPDFPFEMDGLDCSFVVPKDYPASVPTLKVKNHDIPRGFAINVEHGFDGLCRERKGLTLLALISALDRNLEAFLSEKKAEIIKLVANADKRHLVDDPVSVVVPTAPVAAAKPAKQPEPVYTKDQKVQAAARRQSETRQLEARLGRMPLFRKSGDGIAYTIPIEPRRRSELPAGLQAVKTITLYVPVLYPLHPCRVQLDAVNSVEAKAAENAFEHKSKDSTELNLMAHVNNFSTNLHIMAQQPEIHAAAVASPPVSEMPGPTSQPEAQPAVKPSLFEDSHIKVIPRPPEWDQVDDEDDDSDSGEYTYDSGDESSEQEENDDIRAIPAIVPTEMPLINAEKGTAIQFPFIELYGIELLEVTTLNITVKCERCKEQSDFTNLKNNTTKNEVCRKCSTQLSATFRRDLVHAHAVRAGFLDLSGCVPVDMLPSSFTPTCSECSTSYPQPGITSVRGETTTNVCRECHKKFTFKIPEIKFLRISNPLHPPSSGPRRKKEVLGLVAGTELPRRGRCKHYSKSLRWFRFSCCQKIYACDRCHDEGEEHVNEHANRMVCGFCSREQNYRPEDCGVCHGVLVGNKGGGFWEGGKGTRDRVRMSRKDKRKYRRAPREGGKKVGGAAPKS